MPEHRAPSRWTPANVSGVVGGMFLTASAASFMAALLGLLSRLGMAAAGVLLLAGAVFLAWADGFSSGSSSGAP